MSNAISEAYEILSQELTTQDIRYRLVPIERIQDLKKAFAYTLEHEIDCPEFVEFISSINWYGALNSFPEAKSILVASVYNPPGKVMFKKKDRDIEAIIPQGYIKFYPKQKALQKIITEILTPLGYRTERILLPVKLLAVCSGLAEYGKNNITYVEDFGSTHFLGAFITDMPSNDDFWSVPKVMDAVKIAICAE